MYKDRICNCDFLLKRKEIELILQRLLMRVMKIGLCMTISCEKDTDLRRIKFGGLQLTQMII